MPISKTATKREELAKGKKADDEDGDEITKEPTDEEKDDDLPSFLKDKRDVATKKGAEVGGSVLNPDDYVFAAFDTEKFMGDLDAMIQKAVKTEVKAALGGKSVLMKAMEYIVNQNEELREQGLDLQKALATVDETYALVKGLTADIDDAGRKTAASRTNTGRVRTSLDQILHKATLSDVAPNGSGNGNREAAARLAEVPALIRKANELEAETMTGIDGYDQDFLRDMNNGRLTDDQIARFAKGVEAAEGRLTRA